MESVQRRVAHLHSVLLPGASESQSGPSAHPCSAGDGRRVAILGAGIIGLETAMRLSEAYPTMQITVISDQCSPDTTSDGAGGLWKPYQFSNTPAEMVNRWGRETYEHYLSILHSEECRAAGTILTSSYTLLAEPEPAPFWASAVPHFRMMDRSEVAALDPSGKHRAGWVFMTIITEGRVYLPWLQSRLATRGCRFERRSITSVGDVAEYDAVVNCLGLGARDVFGDTSMYPIRGQVMRMRAPWLRHHIQADKNTYIIPNSDTVVVGGTAQRGDWDLTVRAEDRADILERACAVVPSLRTAPVVREWVGLRPGRDAVRLETEVFTLRGRRVPVIHNYGHSRSGLTLAWGCAGDAVALLADALGLPKPRQ